MLTMTDQEQEAIGVASEKADKMLTAFHSLADEFSHEGRHKESRIVRQVGNEMEVETAARLYDIIRAA